MKTKTLLMVVIGAMVFVACASPAPVAETVMEEVVPANEMAPAEEADSIVSETQAAPAEEAMVVVSFSQDVWPILEKYAVAAHGGKGGVFLENYEDISKVVVAGDPENSMLYKALIGDGVKRMPPDAPLPDAMIQTIYNWIKQGALNN